MVVPALAQRGVKVRGLIRDASQGAAVLERGAAEIAVGDLTNRSSLNEAIAGVDAVFYIAPAFIPDEAQVGQQVVDAASKAGVRRFVFSSVIHPVLSSLVNHAAKVPVEEAILNSGMEYALLHPALFFQGIARSWSKVRRAGVYSEPWSPDTRFSRVDYRDVAEVAAIALTEDSLTFGTYELCAPGYDNRHDVAQLMSDVLGQKVRAATLDLPGAANGANQSSPSPMEMMFDWYDHHGLLGNSLTLRAILGREPRTLRAYLQELAAQPDEGGQ
jgi:uncharacterized protein YbjT (DUF2867 family)